MINNVKKLVNIGVLLATLAIKIATNSNNFISENQ